MEFRFFPHVAIECAKKNFFRWIFLENDQVNEVCTFSFLPSSAKHQVPQLLEHLDLSTASDTGHIPLQLGSDVAAGVLPAQVFGLAPFGNMEKKIISLFFLENKCKSFQISSQFSVCSCNLGECFCRCIYTSLLQTQTISFYHFIICILWLKMKHLANRNKNKLLKFKSKSIFLTKG